MGAAQNKKVREFMQQQVLTAPREQLLLMLVDGAVKFADRAKDRLEAKDYEQYGQNCMRAQRIMMELICSLRRDLIGDELYNNLVGLYHFCYARLIEANLRRDAALLAEATKILLQLRDMWHEAVAKDAVERNSAMATEPKPAPRPPVPRSPQGGGGKPVVIARPSDQKPRGGLSITG